MKKYFEKFKDLKSTNKKLYYATICMFVLVGFTFAYVIDQISGGAISKVFITADTADSLLFEVDKDISIKPSQFNFTAGGEDLSDTATATARLKANSTDNTAKYTYNVYFQISTNEYIYTTEDKKPEMILQVTNPNGENLTEINGLVYYSNLQGFDITEVEYLIPIAENYEISSNSSSSFTVQNWIVTVKFINLDTNQSENEGKTLEGKILVQKNKIGDINVAVDNMPLTYGAMAELNCNDSDSVYSDKYNRIEVSGFSSNKSFCNLNFVERVKKQFFNNYLISIAGTSQGNGSLVHETFDAPDFTNATRLTQSEYGTISQYSSTSNSSTSGTVVSNAFTYNNNEWTSVPVNLTSSIYYHLKFTLLAGSEYQLCFEMPSGNVNNQLFLYAGDSIVSINGSNYLAANNSFPKYGCLNLGNLNTSTEYRLVQRAYSEILPIKFYVLKTTNTTSVDTGYRYEGQDPNNYVWFNNELWRIIGIMNERSHGQKGQNLVKMIKINSIGGLTWNTESRNHWTISPLKELLNNEYLYSKNGTNGDNCFSTISNHAKCDYRYTGINTRYRRMIKEVTWYLSGVSSSSFSSSEIYEYERDSESNYTDIPKSVNAKVGLIYLSDYGYAVPAVSCARTQQLYSYSSATCTLNNWLYGQGSYLTITPSSRNSASSNNNQIYSVSSYGYPGVSGEMIYPVVYLDSSVYVIDGDGSITNPYIIGM